MGIMIDVIDNNITSEIDSPLSSDINRLTDLEKKVVAYMETFYITYWNMIDEQMDWVLWISEAAIGVTVFQAVNAFIGDIIGEVEVTYEDIESHVDTMLEDTKTLLWDMTHYFTSPIDAAIGDITAMLGFRFRDSDGTIISATGDVLHRLSDIEYTLEYEIAKFDEETIEKLTWVADHYEEIKALAEGDIDAIVTLVLNEIEGEINSIVATQIAPYVTRLETVEQIVATHQFFFFDWLMDVVAWMLTGMTIPIEDIEDALITVGEWFIDEIFEITNPLEARILALEEGTSEGVGITEDEVRDIVNEMLADLEGIAGPQGPVGPPGPMGPIGPAGPPGEVEIEIGDYIHEIDVALHDRLTSVLYQASLTITGAVDKLWYDMNAVNDYVWEEIKPIGDFLTDDMRTSLTDIVEAFGTPEALLSYLVNAPEGQEEPMLDMMQILLTMSFERGL